MNGSVASSTGGMPSALTSRDQHAITVDTKRVDDGVVPAQVLSMQSEQQHQRRFAPMGSHLNKLAVRQIPLLDVISAARSKRGPVNPVRTPRDRPSLAGQSNDSMKSRARVRYERRYRTLGMSLNRSKHEIQIANRARDRCKSWIDGRKGTSSATEERMRDKKTRQNQSDIGTSKNSSQRPSNTDILSKIRVLTPWDAMRAIGQPFCGW